MRPSRSVSATLCPLVVSYTDRLFTLWLCPCNYFTAFPSLPVKMGMNSEDGIWCLWKAYQQFINSIFLGCLPVAVTGRLEIPVTELSEE